MTRAWLLFVAACGSSSSGKHADAPLGGDAPGGDAPAGGCTSCVTLASGQVTPDDLVVANGTLYWTDLGTTSANGSVDSCSATACSASPLTTAGGPIAIVYAAPRLFWLASGRPYTCTPPSCTAMPVVTAISTVTDLATDGTNIYWGDSNGVEACPVAGCGSSPTRYSASGNAGADVIAVDAANVYWFRHRQLYSCPVAGCSAPPAAILTSDASVDLEGPSVLASDGNHLYWNTQGSGAPNGEIWSCTIGSCAASAAVLASGFGQPIDLVVDSGTLYWVNFSDGTVMKCGAAGCNHAPTTIATNEAFPGSIAVDATRVYWTDYRSGLIRAAER